MNCILFNTVSFQRWWSSAYRLAWHQLVYPKLYTTPERSSHYMKGCGTCGIVLHFSFTKNAFKNISV